MTAVKYSIFAAFSILINLGFQHISFLMYDGFASLYVAMFVGTLTGLISKYILDKKFIFYHQTSNQKDEAKNFMLYSFMGVFTTIIFWGTEMSFDFFFDHPLAKYIGGFIGLTVGYIIKYFLDKKYVFNEVAS